MNVKKKNRNNELDPAFGTSGQLYVSAPGAGATQLPYMKMDVIGTIYLYGQCLDPDLSLRSSNATVTRLTNDGQIDMTFGIDGFAVESDWEHSLTTGLVFPNSGGLFTAGTRRAPLFLASYTHEGTGTIVTEMTGVTRPQLLATTNNKLLISTKTIDMFVNCIIYSKKTDGSVDESFGEQGAAYFLPREDAEINQMAQSINSETFYTAGRVDYKAYIARLTMQGELDTTFARNGLLTWSGADDSTAAARKILPLSNNGVLSLIRQSGIPSAIIINFDSTGIPDSGFNHGNPLPVDDNGLKNITDMALQADGKILITSYDADKSYLTRYLPDGELDTSFGENGSVAFSKKDPFDFALQVLVQPDRKIVVLGSIVDTNNSVLSAALVRLMP